MQKLRNRRHKYILGILGIIILLVLGRTIRGGNDNTMLDDTSNETNNNQPSIVRVDTLFPNELSRSVTIDKSGTLASASSITISAQAAGRAQTIRVSEGQRVPTGRQLISLADTVNNYYLQTQRAQVQLENAQLQLEQGQSQLDKSVADASIALQQAQNSTDTLLQQIDQQLRQAELNLDTILTNTDSTITTLQSQLFTLKTSLVNQNRTLTNLIDQTIGETIAYRNQGEDFESSLIARSRTEYNQIESDYDNLTDLQSDIQSIQTNLSGNQLLDTVDSLIELSETHDTVLLNLQTVYQNALVSASFTTQVQSTFLSQVQGLISSNIALRNQLISYKDQLNKLIQSNADGQTNADITREQAQLQLEQTQTQLEDSRVKTQLSLEQARDAYDFALRNRDIQLKLLQSAIDAAQVNYADAAKNSSKLSITAPIDGVVGEVLVDKGQDITIGTPLLTFVGVAENEVRISVNNSQRQSLTIGDPVQVTYGAINYTGSITSVGSVADGTLGYPVTISIPDDAVTVGGTVRVSIPIRTDLPLVPVSALRPRGTARAMASLRDGSQVVMQEVRIGQTRDTMIEIDINTIPDGYQIITTDLTNYDPTRQTIQLNNIASDLSNIMTGSILTGNTMTP